MLASDPGNFSELEDQKPKMSSSSESIMTRLAGCYVIVAEGFCFAQFRLPQKILMHTMCTTKKAGKLETQSSSNCSITDWKEIQRVKERQGAVWWVGEGQHEWRFKILLPPPLPSTHTHTRTRTHTHTYTHTHPKKSSQFFQLMSRWDTCDIGKTKQANKTFKIM